MSASITSLGYIAENETKNYGSFNKVDSGSLSLSAQPRVLSQVLSPSVPDSLANSTETEIAATSSNLSSVAGVSRSGGTFTVATAGVYLFNATVVFATNATGIRAAYWRTSTSSNSVYGRQQVPACTGAETMLNVTAIVNLAAGGAVTLYGYQTSGGALQVNVTLPAAMSCYKLS